MKIDFSIDPLNNVTIILAENSTGKTTLMQSIRWCLYGEVDLANKEHLLNYDIRNSSRNKYENIEVSLIINEDNTDFEITRVRQVIVENERREGETLTLKYKNDKGETIYINGSADKPDSPEIKKINRMINRILSKDMSDYFLFDGERINNLGQNNAQSRKDISKAISAINEFAILDNSLSSLNRLSRIYRDEITQESNDKELIRQKRNITVTQDKIERIKNDIEKYEEEFNNLFSEIDLLDKKLQRYDASKSYVSQRNQKEKRYAENLNMKKKDESFIAEKRYQYDINSLMFKLQQKYSELNFNEEFNNETIPDMKADSIDFILDRGICICGEKITEKHQKHLLAQRKKQPPISNAVLVRQFSNLLNRYTVRIDSLKNDIIERIDRYDDIELQLIEINREIDELTSYIGNIDKDGVSKLDRQRNELKSSKKTLERMIIESKGELSNHENNLVRSENAYNEALEQNNTQKFNQIKLNLVEQSKIELNEMIARMKIERKQEIEDSANQHFQNIIYKDKVIQINDKFDYTVTESNGEIASPSEGERTAISMSLILAIIDIHKKNSSNKSNPETNMYTSTKEFSIILDAAFATLDNQFSKNISEKLPKSIEQVILFTTKKQYSGAVEEALNSRIGYLYQLDIPSDEDQNSLTNKNLSIIYGG